MNAIELMRAAEGHRIQGRLQDARQICNQVLRTKPGDANALHMLGVIALQEGNARGAAALVERAIKSHRSSAQFHRTMGIVLQALGELDAAISHLQRSLRLKADDPWTHSVLGRVLHEAGRLAESAVSLKRALALAPDDPDAHFYVAVNLLIEGDFEQGWVEYDFRPARRELERSGLFERYPEWRGEDLAGKTLLLRDEQGFGDVFQYARYIPLLAARGGRIVLATRKEMLTLLATLAGVAEVVDRDSLPVADFCCALGSLPRAFGTRLDNIPATVPYLAPPPEYAARWAGRLASDALRVGLVWAGSPTHTNDRNRSLPLTALSRLSDVPGAALYSLQKGPAAGQIAGAGMKITPLGDELVDFADTAAVLSQLDVLVTVDTSVAHLAGALARPTLVLLPTGGDWRWLSGRTDSPWYPTLRLVRQSTPRNWSDVVERVAADLSGRIAAAAQARTPQQGSDRGAP